METGVYSRRHCIMETFAQTDDYNVVYRSVEIVSNCGEERGNKIATFDKQFIGINKTSNVNIP